jgi:predicted nucleotidyltransferase component of viral defense system
LTELHEIALTAQEFLRRIPEDARAAGRDGRYHTDYALTRVVAANCAAIGEHADDEHPTDLVVKGGFAVRHLYGSPRFSKDADLAMVSDDLAMEGPKLIKWPLDMTVQERVSDGMASWVLRIRYLGPDGVARNAQCDLNDRSRAIRKRPPQKRVLRGLFIDPFPVWAATTQEILGEKMFALMDSRRERRTLRVKDIFDLRHVLRLEHEIVIASETRSVYDSWQQAAKPGVAPRISDYTAALTALASTRQAFGQWEIDVFDSVPDAPTVADASSELVELLQRRVITGR